MTPSVVEERPEVSLATDVSDISLISSNQRFSMRLQLLQPKRTKEVLKLRASFEQPQPECGFIFRQRRSVQFVQKLPGLKISLNHREKIF
nr:hypothetical protein [Tanacetum cinerariifolium]